MSAIPHQDLHPELSTEVSATVPRRRPLLTVMLAGGLVAAAALTWSGSYATIDTGVAEWGAALVPGSFVSAMNGLTHLGGGEILYPIAAVIAVLAYRRRDMHALVFVGMAVVGQSLLSNGLKVTFARSRPDLAQVAEWTGWSFPSGHALAAAAVLMAIALTVGRWTSASSRTILVSAAVVLAVVVALSRVVLGVHWLSDVLAGLALGWAWVAISYWLAKRVTVARSA